MLSGAQATLASAWMASLGLALMRFGGFLLSRSWHENRRVAGGDSALGDDVFHPGEFFAVGRNGGLFEAVGGRKRRDDFFGCTGRFGFRGGCQARFGGFLLVPLDSCAEMRSGAQKMSSEAAAVASRDWR